MKILVCISKTPDTTTKISFTENNTKFDTANVQYIVNPYDEWYALVRGIELKEASGGSVTTITVGKADSDAIIRKALAIGADDAVRIDAEPTDAYNVAFQIAEYARDKEFDLILAGKETIDYNGSEVGGMIAEFLGWPYISYAGKLNVEGSSLTAEREIEGGKEVVEGTLPVVITAQKGMAEQRIPNMRGIMQARTKPLNVVQPANGTDLTSIVSYELLPPKAECKFVDPEHAEELVNLLHNEAKVI